MDEILWKNRARRQLRKFPKMAQLSILDAVDTLVDLSAAKNVKKLTNHQYDFRQRVGNYRVLFNYDDEGEVHIVTVEEVKKRDDRTY